MSYCANCEAEATYQVAHPDGRETPLCATCAEAYRWGQASPTAQVTAIGPEPISKPWPPIACPTCGSPAIYVRRLTAGYDGQEYEVYAALHPDGFDWSGVLPAGVDDYSSTDELAECANCGVTGDLADFGFGTTVAPPSVYCDCRQPGPVHAETWGEVELLICERCNRPRPPADAQ